MVSSLFVCHFPAVYTIRVSMLMSLVVQLKQNGRKYKDIVQHATKRNKNPTLFTEPPQRTIVL